MGLTGPGGLGKQDQEVGVRKDQEDGRNRNRRLVRTGPGGWGEQDQDVGENRTRWLG